MTEPSGILDQPIYINGVEKPFGEWTVEDVKARSDELRLAAGVGPKIAAVSRAWADLGRRMQDAPATRVADLDAGVVDGIARALGVIAPGGSLLGP